MAITGIIEKGSYSGKQTLRSKLDGALALPDASLKEKSIVPAGCVPKRPEEMDSLILKSPNWND
ncbi:hypothetical protein [Bacillus massilinigeriensis]|uniref:hypothetical protein n=1 Tax=Bacillus mediterraneensis TaxID=1805474 RepID=UPI0008F82231|nr:hypothetical protein [Bacillus mediterraneensis]